MSSLALTYSRREWVIELLLLLAESAVIWMTAAVLFGPFGAGALSIPPLLIVGLVATAGIAPLALYDRGIWGWRFSAIMAGIVVASTLATIKVVAFPDVPWPESGWLRETVRSLVFESSSARIVVWAPIGLAVVIWWLARLQGAPGLERARATLRGGAGVAGLVVIGSAFVESGVSDRALTVAIVVFFLATLVALAIARQGSGVTHTREGFSSTVILPAVAIGVLALVGALLVTFDWARAFPRSISFLGVMLDPVFQILVLLLTGLVFVIALPIMWLLSLGNYEPSQVMQFAGFEQVDSGKSALGWEPPDPVRYLLAAIVLVLIFYGVVRFGLHLTRREFERDETGTRDFGSGRGIGKWLERFHWPFGRERADPLAGLRGDPAWVHTVRVREIYASWLRWAERHTLGRDVGETTLELDHRTGPRLESPISVAALDELTVLYNDVRYGQTPATAEQADRAAQLWRQLKSNEPSHAKES